MKTFFCEACGSSWTAPETIDADLRQTIAALSRHHQPLEAIRQLRINAHVSLADAKAITQHLTRTPGCCQRCAHPLDGTAMRVCVQCCSINYDW
jgi:hypothetical protein